MNRKLKILGVSALIGLVFTISINVALASTGYYYNSNHSKVSSPIHTEIIPVGASAQCRDLTYSFSQSRRGTCSHHGGVKKWL